MEGKIKIITWILSALIFGFVIVGISITSLDDSISKQLRKRTEYALSGYFDRLAERGAKGELNFLDKTILHSGLLTGTFISQFVYPEAADLLFHYVYGDGSDLELASAYFKKSNYLSSKIDKLGPGIHGPIGFKQHQDYRLSLAFNPYYLEIQAEKVRIYHPKIEFAPAKGEKVPTKVPLGKLTIRVYDNLVSALNPTPFYVFSEWSRDH